jgi:quercetin dioxygenase-like cupin family protein
MKRVLYSLLVAAVPFGSALADAPKEKDAKVTLVYQHELPNVPGKSIKGVLVEYGPGGYSPGHTHPKSAFIYATVLEGAIRSQVNDGPVTIYKAGQSFSELPGTATASAPMAARRSRPPHSESTFPQSRKILAEILAGVPDDEQAKIAGGNTARVYNFDVASLTGRS